MEKYQYSNSVKGVRRSYENVSSLISSSRSFDGSKQPRVLPVNFISGSNKIKNYSSTSILKKENSYKNISIKKLENDVNIPIQITNETFNIPVNKNDCKFLYRHFY